MKLTGAERLILIMLSDIHEKLDIKDSVEPELVRSAIYSDCEWGLTWAYPGIFDSLEERHRDPRVTEVVNYLDMWSFVEESIDALSENEKDNLDQKISPYRTSHVKFTGFDGHDETSYIGIARFLTRDLGRFSRFKDRDLDSHLHESANTYARMYSVFEPKRKTLIDRLLNLDELTEIIQQRVHPSSRET